MHRIRIAAQLLLGVTLTYAGITHLTTSRIEFQAQVPTWLPLSPDFVVIASGVVEILLGLCLISLQRRRHVGRYRHRTLLRRHLSRQHLAIPQWNRRLRIRYRPRPRNQIALSTTTRSLGALGHRVLATPQNHTTCHPTR